MKINSLFGLKKVSIKPHTRTPSKTLPFSIEHQQQTEWCWIACTVSVNKFYSPTSPLTQCELANTAVKSPNCSCCEEGNSKDCNRPGGLQDTLAAVGHYVTFVWSKTSMANIEGQMNIGRPLGMRIGWNNKDGHRSGSGHFVMIYGFSDGGSEELQFLNIGDPWYGPSIQPYERFPSRYNGGGSWTGSYFTKPTTKSETSNP